MYACVTIYVPCDHKVRKWCQIFLDLELTDGCELPCECWELNLGPLQKQVLFCSAILQPKRIECIKYTKNKMTPENNDNNNKIVSGSEKHMLIFISAIAIFYKRFFLVHLIYIDLKM